MGIFLGVVLILMGACVFSYIFKQRLELTFPLFILSLITFLYLFGLFTILDIGVYVAAGLITIFFVGVVIDSIRKKKGINLKNIPILVLILSFVVVNVILLYSSQVDNWDEFSHWAIIVKRMFIDGNFGNLNGGVLFPGYPPATGIFHNFFLVLGGSYVEQWLYISMNILNFSLIMPIFTQLKRKCWLRNSLIIFFALVLPCVFDPGYYASLFVDIYLGVLFAYIIYIYFHNKRLSYFKLINISFAVFVLTASKASGLGLALIALIIIGIDVICFQRRRLKRIILNKKKYLLFLIPIISMIFSKISWSIYLNIFNLSAAWGTSNITLKGIVSYILKPTVFESQVTTAFISSLFSLESLSVVNLSPVIFCLVMVVVMGFLSCCFDEKKRSVTTMVGLMMGFIVYAITLLILYLFTYMEYEAVRLASFSRYMSTYITALILLLFYVTVHFINVNKMPDNKNFNKVKNIIVAIITCVAVSVVPLGTVINNVFFRSYTKGYYSTNNSLSDFKSFSQTLDEEKDKIYYIYANSTGATYYRAIYYSLPVKINLSTELGFYSWSLGAPRYDGDVWSINLTVEEWEKILIDGGYTYVYVHHADEIFIETYKFLFKNEEEIVDNSKFIVKKDGNTVILEKI